MCVYIYKRVREKQCWYSNENKMIRHYKENKKREKKGMGAAWPRGRFKQQKRTDTRTHRTTAQPEKRW